MLRGWMHFVIIPVFIPGMARKCDVPETIWNYESDIIGMRLQMHVQRGVNKLKHQPE